MMIGYRWVHFECVYMYLVKWKCSYTWHLRRRWPCRPAAVPTLQPSRRDAAKTIRVYLQCSSCLQPECRSPDTER